MADAAADVAAWVRAWFAAKGPLPEGPRADFFAAGIIDSLAVVQLVADIEAAFGIRFEDRHYQDPRFSTVGGLAELISELRR